MLNKNLMVGGGKSVYTITITAWYAFKSYGDIYQEGMFTWSKPEGETKTFVVDPSIPIIAECVETTPRVTDMVGCRVEEISYGLVHIWVTSPSASCTVNA